MSAMSRPAGWGYPSLGSRKEHWFAEGQVRSGCGRYGRFVPFPIEDARSVDPTKVCVDCARAADKAGAA